MTKIDKNATDQELMQAYCNDEFGAFELIYERYAGKIYGFLKQRLKEDHVDEVFQDIYMKFHKTRHKYQDSYALLPWLYTITKSCLIDFTRKNQRYHDVLKELECDHTKENLSPQAPYNVEELIADVKGKPKEALELRYKRDLDFEEMAAVLKTSSAGARKLVSRGLTQIRRIFRGAQK